MTVRQIKYKLAAINFFLADVRDGLGPFLAVYLISSLHWHSDDIGLIMTLSALMTLVFQLPAGALTDIVHKKRLMFILASGGIALSMLAIQFIPIFKVIVASKIVIGIAGAFLAPVIAALSLGTVGHQHYAQQVAMNEAYNHSGNVFAAVMAAVFAKTLGLNSLFTFTAVMAIFAIGFCLSIRPNQIDHDVARGFVENQSHGAPSGFSVLFENKYLLMFGFCILLFHLANAAMLLLIGEEIAAEHSGASSVVFLSGSIISAQGIMFLMALLTKRYVDSIGRRPLFLVAFFVLPIRGLLFTLSSDPYYLLAVQCLDGVGAGLFGALFPIVVQDMTEGTGRYNVALGALSTMQGVGAAFSTLISGYIVTAYGFSMAFYLLSAIALCAFVLFAYVIPETKSTHLVKAADA